MPGITKPFRTKPVRLEKMRAAGFIGFPETPFSS
jgi:hypothetical protein